MTSRLPKGNHKPNC